MKDTKTQEFLQKLKELFDEYEATLAGCGCCGSPYIVINDKTIDDVLINYGNNELTYYGSGR